MVVDAVIRHWVTVVVPTTYGLEGRDLLVGGGGGGFNPQWEPTRQVSSITTDGLEGRDLLVGGGGGFHRLWEPSRPGHCLQVFRASYL